MNKNNENKWVPKLRFPEFEQTSKWVVSSVEEECFVKGRIGYRGYTTNDLVSQGEGALVLGGKHIQNQILDLSDPTYLTWEKYYESPEIMIEIGDIIFSQRGTLGDCAIIEKEIGPATINPSMVLLKNITCIPKFLYYVLIGDYIQNEVKKSKGFGAIPMLSQKQIREFSFLKPDNPKEQQKIAACLSSLDELIAAETQYIASLRDHKKGLLQNLLPQAGETVPKFRFKEFEDCGDWEETTLTKVADYENGKAHEQDIADNGEFIVVNSKFISQDGEVKKFTNTAFLPATKGDVLMVLSDIPNGKAIAKCFLVEEDNRYTVNQRICRITPRNVNSKILYYLLNRNPYFLAFDDGVKQTNLRKDDVLNCPLLIPKDPKEQDKIADTLSSVDDLINAQNQKLEALQLHKKGLLQGLFPNLNEVTE